MARRAVEASVATTLADSKYNMNKWFICSAKQGDSFQNITPYKNVFLIKTRTDLGTPFIGPLVSGIARPMENIQASSVYYPSVISWSPDIDWVFLADSSVASITKKIQLYVFDRKISTYSYIGKCLIRFPQLGNKTVVGFKMTYDIYSTGVVSNVGGDSVVAVGSTWVTDRIPAGCRIGFGDSVPWKITSWYTISAIQGDTKLLLTSSVPTADYVTNKPYVIEDLRAYHLITNATTNLGGLYASKGLNFQMFGTIGDSVIPVSAVTDNLRRTYWFAAPALAGPRIAGDGSGDSRGAGLAIASRESWQTQYAYALDTNVAGAYRVYKYNVRNALIIHSTGLADSKAFTLATGNKSILGTVTQTNNLVYAKARHGPRIGVDPPRIGESSLYFLTTGASNRMFRAAISRVTTTNVNWIGDSFPELPPDSTATWALTSLLYTLAYDNITDTFIVTSTGAAGVRSYVTKYRSRGDTWTRMFLVDDKQIDQGLMDLNVVTHPSINASSIAVDCVNGVAHLVNIGTTAVTNVMHSVTIGADWAYADTTGMRVIAPRLITPYCSKFVRSYVIRDRFLGNDILGVPTDPLKIYYRTTGIADSYGTWTAVPEPNDLSAITRGDSIQFSFTFNTISQRCLPARIFACGVVYDDESTDSHFEPSVEQSNLASKIFAWRFRYPFHSAVPALRVRLYNVISKQQLLADSTRNATFGTWQKSINGGGSWAVYNTNDKSGDSDYIRYTPTVATPDSASVRALLTAV
jgi:hypothetical protein